MKKILIYFFILFLISCFSSSKLPNNSIKNIKVEDTIIKKNFDTSKLINDSVKKIDTTKHNFGKQSFKEAHHDLIESIEVVPNIRENLNITPDSDPKKMVNTNDASYKKADFSKKDKNIESNIKINEGKLIYSIPDTMKLGNIYTITIRIKKNSNNVKIIDSLYKQKIVDIKVTNSMEVVIIDPSPNETKNFNILKQNSDKQLIEDDNYTEWVYSVQPLKSGNLKLNIIVSIIKDDNLKQVVYFNTTYVKSNPGVVVQTFWEKYWQWLLSTIIIPFVIFIYKSRKKINETI